LLITLGGGILERLVDHQEFPTIGPGLWFAVQTVTTVGYGDVTPKQGDGRFIGAIVMLAGIGFLAVITASVTSSLVEGSRSTVRRAVRRGRDAAASGNSANDSRGSERQLISRHLHRHLITANAENCDRHARGARHTPERREPERRQRHVL
jgi:Ion channel